MSYPLTQATPISSREVGPVEAMGEVSAALASQLWAEFHMGEMSQLTALIDLPVSGPSGPVKDTQDKPRGDLCIAAKPEASCLDIWIAISLKLWHQSW